MPKSLVRPSPPDPSKIASGKPGAVHTFTGWLGCEERVKRPHPRRRIHPLAGIGNGEQHVLARLDLGMPCGVGVIERSIDHLDGELAARRHSIAGIDREVEDGRLKFRRVYECVPEARAVTHSTVTASPVARRISGRTSRIRCPRLTISGCNGWRRQTQEAVLSVVKRARRRCSSCRYVHAPCRHGRWRGAEGPGCR
jgi:hypothetical protein